MVLKARTHVVEVAGVGQFEFQHRTLTLQVGVEAILLRMLDGPVSSEQLRYVARAIATIQKLMVRAPDRFDLDAIDPVNDAEVDDVLKVYGGLLEAEATFRRPASA